MSMPLAAIEMWLYHLSKPCWRISNLAVGWQRQPGGRGASLQWLHLHMSQYVWPENKCCLPAMTYNKARKVSVAIIYV